MAERVLRGAPASPGVALGVAWRDAETVRASGVVAWEDQGRELEVALRALHAAARELTDLASALGPEQAEIVEAGALMAHDPALARAVEEAILGSGLPAPDAILRACGELADVIAGVGDEMLAARADDVRSLGRRAARLAGGGEPAADVAPKGEVILVADDLGPGDVAEHAAAVAGVALARGGSTAHAAIVARSLGIPMVTGLGPGVLELPAGTELALDGTAGTVAVAPGDERAGAAARSMADRRAAATDGDDRPAVTADGRRVVVLANVASAAEVDVGLSGGAEGVGLVRTELAFLEATEWPDERQHAAALEPILARLDGRRAVVRVLDFGADKAPLFLRGVDARGIELLLGHPEAFLSQLRAILACGQRHDGIRVMLPLVESAEQIEHTRELIEYAARQLGVTALPPLGAMIETRSAVLSAAALAAASDFISIGTNDLTASVLGADRFRDAAGAAPAHDPAVLRCIASVVAAGHAAGLSIEVCGEAASDAVTAPLLIGLGIDELSVGAARVAVLRRWIRELNAADAGGIARCALARETAEAVAQLGAREAAAREAAAREAAALGERDNGAHERVERSGGVHALGA